MTTQTSKKWNKVKLGNIVNFQYGYTASAQNTNTGTKFLRITDIVPDLINWESVPYCKIDSDKLHQFKINKGDILVARTGATAGYAKLIRKQPEQSVFASYLIRLVIKNDSADPDFVGRIIESNLFKEFVVTHAGGSAQPHANAPVLKNFEIDLPDLPTQKQIADVLSAYDDLIENNNRRIKILENIAQKIYTEWFVNFRFPGYEKAKFGKDGLPEGWELKTLGQMAKNFDSKRRPISKLKRAEIRGNIPYYGAAKIIDYVNEVLLDGKYLLFAEDGSVITKEGFPVLQLVNEKFWVSNHAHVLQGNDVSTEYLYLALSRVSIQGYITGAAQPKITQENLNRIPVLSPSVEINQLFNKVIEPIFLLRFSIEKTLGGLQKTRDLLIPQLVTGKLEIKS